MQKSKIIIATTSYIYFDRRMQRIALALVDAGFEISWLGRSKPSRESAKLSSAAFPFKTIFIDHFFKRGFLFYLEYNLRLFFKLSKIVNTETIVNAVDLDTILACGMVKRLRKNKMVFDAHEYFQEVPELATKPMKKKIWAWLGRRFVKGNPHNYTVNDSLASVFKNMYQQEFGVIRNVPTLLPSNAHSAKANKEKILLYLGVLNKGRGAELAIEAIKQLPDYKLWFVGHGDLYDTLHAQVQAEKLSEQVYFHGWVKPDDIPELIAQAKIGLNLLDNISESYRLSLANKFFDYIHALLPSVNMAFPEYKSIIDKHPVGVMIDELDVAQLVNAVRRLEEDECYNKSTQACIAAKQDYNWQKESKSLVDFYQALI